MKHDFSGFGRDSRRAERTIKGGFVVIVILNIAFIILVFFGVRWLIQNRNEVAKEFGKATYELKENRDAGRAEAAEENYVVDTLNIK